MRRLLTCLAAFGLVGVGYLMGAAGLPSPSLLLAQADKKAEQPGEGAPDITGPSEEAQAKIKAADEALKAALEILVQEDLYVAATTGINSLAVTAGGVNAVKDLESGRGVDPETFAGLYAGLATDEIAAHLERDADGRLIYKGKLIRMYPISRLKSLYASRAVLSGEKPPEKKPGRKAAGDAGDQ
jgi:hypothetical protein